MTHTKDESLKLALEALTIIRGQLKSWGLGDEAIAVCKQALAAQPASEADMQVYRSIADNYRKDLAAAQPAVQEPVAWREALERIADPRNTHFAGDAQVVAREALATPPAAQHDRVRELECVIADLTAECKELRAAQPAVPDAITDDSESPEYRTGWNDYRAAMMEMMK
jgi:hypothetical protein